ncbi:MAG: exonuclease SbcCD subunit D [Chloroflexota bacterium]|nr:exonuclease SbcCD subunit D [Chloroflexota bacterium]
MRLLHVADVHLGYQQYNSSDRFNDFGYAFECAVSYGVEQKVDAILIAGDLFHKAAVEPWAYIQAVDVLSIAREAQIPVIAVEGNHDQARYRAQISWLTVLAHEGYLILLRPKLEQETVTLQTWDGEEGSYVDLGNVRIVGVPWLGASAAFWLPRLAEAIEGLPRTENGCTMLLTHAGIEGEMPNISGCWTHTQIAPLRASVDYVALGHMHKPFEREGWLFNPGSLETCAMEERKWERGMYDVTVGPEGSFAARHIKASPRPFFREMFFVGRYQAPTELYQALRERVRRQAPRWHEDGRKPVVEVYLEGTLPFDRVALDLDEMRRTVVEEVDPLVARVNPAGLQLPGLQLSEDEQLSPRELERAVLREIVLNDSRYASHPEEWAEVMLDVKERALKGDSPESILGLIEAQLDAYGSG